MWLAMLLVQFAQDLVPCFADLSSWSVSQVWDWHPFGLDWALLAQQFETDVFANTRKAFSNFLSSGKLWTLLIGVGIGYFIGKITTYG